MAGRNLFANDMQQTSAPKGRNLFAEPEKDETFLQKLPRNVTAGLANAGHSLLNTPYDLAQAYKGYANRYEANETGQPPNPTSNNWANYIPHQEEQNFAQMLGQKGEGTPADYAVQKGAQYLPEIGTIGSLAKNALPHFTRWGATRNLNRASNLAEGRDILPMNINPEIIREAEQFLPKTAPYRNLINDAEHGDYNALFRLQSDLGKHASDYAGSMFSAAERQHGRAGLTSRNSLLDAIHEQLQGQGQHDISQLMRQGQNDYRRYMGFKPIRNKLAIGGLTGLGIGGVLGLPGPQNFIRALVKNALFNSME